MRSISKLVACRALVISLAITLGVFGVRALQARGQGCETQAQTCPTVDKHAQHEAEEAREREQKAAEHAQHEAAEEAAKQQKALEKAQHEAEEECARQQKAYEHAQHEAAEAQERAQAKQPACIRCAPRCEPVKETSTIIIVTPAPEPTPEPFPEGLPKTATPMSLIGLIGVLSLTGSSMRFRR